MELKNTDTNELEPHKCMDKFANECNKFAISIYRHWFTLMPLSFYVKETVNERKLR